MPVLAAPSSNGDSILEGAIAVAASMGLVGPHDQVVCVQVRSVGWGEHIRNCWEHASGGRLVNGHPGAGPRRLTDTISARQCATGAARGHPATPVGFPPGRRGQWASWDHRGMATFKLKDFSWERMIAAVDAVRERARRIAAALDRAEIPYAVIGGNAIAAWVARVDVEAVRNTKDVDLLVRREDFERVIDAAESVGFVHQNVAGVDLFLDGPEGSVRSAIHVVFAREKVRPDYVLPAPDVTESEAGPEFTVVALDALVRMKLTSFRLRDRVHLLDLLEVGLIDESWCDRLPPELGARLRELIESADREA